MAIEITPKPKFRIPKWVSVVLAVFIILLLFFVVSYFYLHNSLGKISQKIEEKDKALLKTPAEKELEKEVLLKEQRVNNWAQLILSHRKPGNIFNLLEKTTHPSVVFSEFEFDSAKNLVEIKGSAEDFTALGQQILILKGEKDIKKITLSEVSIAKGGGIDFSLQLTFDSQFFK